MRRFLSENGLSVFLGSLFLLTLVGQSFAGQRAYNGEQAEHGGETLGWLDYVLSPTSARPCIENWQSEFLQFTLFILVTVWLVQKGSNESKPLDSVGLELKQKQQLGVRARARPRLGEGLRREARPLRELARPRR